MTWLNGYRMRLVLVGCVAAIVLGGGSAKADFIFGTPTNLGPAINSSSDDICGSISADGLSLYFHSERTGGSGRFDIWMTTRPTKDDPWGEPVNLGPIVNSSADETFPSIAADGLSLYFGDGHFWRASPRPGGLGSCDIWVTSRPTTSDLWGPPVNLGGPVNTVYHESAPSISSDGLSLFFDSKRPGGSGNVDLWVTTRATTSDPWTEPVNLGPTVNSSSIDAAPSISADGLVLFIDGNGPGMLGINDLWFTTRPSVSDYFGTPVNLGSPLNTSEVDATPCISADGSTLYFASDRPRRLLGDMDLWQVSITPIVDFNGDGIVDSKDICIMVDYWGTDESLCDVGPMPWGDGIVDIQDLIIMTEHLFTYPGAVGYWKLDEVEGDIAYNSTSDNHGILSGNPTWKPDSGQVAGALEFDGIDDYITTDFVLNPMLGSFSAFAWIKGGSPGQVVISQIGGDDWLLADAEGKLMTTLSRGSYRPTLVSGSVITDGDWHHIGFVWDGSHRHLYVDGTDVAEDATDILYLWSSNGGLNIGCGKNLEPGSFWSGLIDDVRIYNRAVEP